MSEGGFDHIAAGAEVRRFFDELWSETDPWDLESSELDQARYERQLALLDDRRYRRALEIGCGAGAFTRRLAPLCDRLLAIDVAERAIAQARATTAEPGAIEFHAANIMEFDLARQPEWDLVVITETVYYLGWQYPMFDVGWLAHSLWRATRPGGRLLMANSTYVDESGGYQQEDIMSPWIIRSYRDLVGNVGFEIEVEETMSGDKDGVGFEILLTRFVKVD
jgi:predicted TPR repeat methyltransferase